MRGRFWAIATVVAAVIVFAVAGYVMTHDGSAADSAATPGYTAPTLTPSSAVTDASSDSPAAATIAFLGDDWTGSLGAGSTDKGFVAAVGAALQVPVRAFAVPGGGYAKSSPQGQTYADLVAAVIAAHPRVVVVSGGRNDVGDYAPTLQQAATGLFAALHQALPQAVLVAVAPWWGDSDHPATLAPVTAAVQAAVGAAGGHYLGEPDPLHGHPDWMADAADPNDAGYAAIAAALAPQLRRLLPG